MKGGRGRQDATEKSELYVMERISALLASKTPILRVCRFWHAQVNWHIEMDRWWRPRRSPYIDAQRTRWDGMTLYPKFI